MTGWPALRMTRLGLACVTALSLAGMPQRGITAAPRAFPDTTSRIAILTDQLGAMTNAQVRFAATHYIGSQKLALGQTRALRKVNPGFIVLHYRLAMWQSAPGVPYILDGTRWGNDYAEVNRHESWFWHNPAGQRITSNQDRKLLMNVADQGFRAYWKESLVRQVEAGEYDGVFFDSASPSLLQWEARAPLDPRLTGRGVRDNQFPELGDRSWIAAWEEWIADLDTFLSRRQIPLIPNIGGLATTWDNTDYTRTAGAFLEGFLDPTFDERDWASAADQTLDLVRKDRIVILQNYLDSPDDVAKRKYLLANYLLMKGRRTYLAYFARDPLQWYPEWDLDLGAATLSPASVTDLEWEGVYRREFANGIVIVNPTGRTVRLTLDRTFRRVRLAGGGAVSADGRPTGSVSTTPASTLELQPKSAEILLR